MYISTRIATDYIKPSSRVVKKVERLVKPTDSVSKGKTLDVRA